jgi:metallo-beta-lactamase class B
LQAFINRTVPMQSHAQRIGRSVVGLAIAFALSVGVAAAHAPASIDCRNCAEWNLEQAPFRIHGNSWYVGPRGLSSVLIKTNEGLILLDGALPQSAPLIAANVAALGFDIRELRWILVSHAHFDHAGGVAELQRLSGARVAASPLAVAALERGSIPADDPLAGYGAAMDYPAVAGVTAVADGERIELGGLSITALHTPGHTPGGSSWHWQSCVDTDCRTLLYADSLNAVSHDSFMFGTDPARVAEFRRSIERVGGLDCELLVAVHPGFTDLLQRHAALAGAEPGDAFVYPGACRDYAAAAAQRFEQRLASEAQPATGQH